MNTEQIQDILADHETRILTLENSLPFTPIQKPEKIDSPEPQWTKKQWEYVQQIKSEVLHYRKEYANIMLELDKLVKRGKNLTDIDKIKMDDVE